MRAILLCVASLLLNCDRFVPPGAATQPGKGAGGSPTGPR